MSLIRCKECDREISDQAKKCPYCGVPIKRSSQANKPLWLKIIAVICGLIAIAVLISGIKDLLKAYELSTGSSNPISNNFYVGNQNNIYILKFKDNNKVILAEFDTAQSENTPRKASGEYELKDDVVDISFSNGVKWKCYVKDDGESLTINNVNFSQTSSEELGKETLRFLDE